MNTDNRGSKGMPHLGVAKSFGASQIAEKFSKECQEDRHQNIWFKEGIDLNEVLSEVGPAEIHSFLAALCGNCPAKFERLNPDKELPIVLGIGPSYEALRQGAQERNLISARTRISLAPAAFRAVPTDISANITESILTM